VIGIAVTATAAASPYVLLLPLVPLFTHAVKVTSSSAVQLLKLNGKDALHVQGFCQCPRDVHIIRALTVDIKLLEDKDVGVKLLQLAYDALKLVAALNVPLYDTKTVVTRRI
jgi:hypothetical protein